MKFFDFFKNKIEFERIKEGLRRRMKLVVLSFIFVLFAGIFVFVGWQYFNKQVDLTLNLQSANQNEFAKILDKKLSLTQEKITQYIDEKLQDIDKKMNFLNEEKKTRTNVDGVIKDFKILDKKFSSTQEKITQYIDEKLKDVDKKINSLKEEKKMRTNVDGVIKEEVKNQMLSLQEERVKQMVKQQYREKRKKLIKKMLEDENDL